MPELLSFQDAGEFLLRMAERCEALEQLGFEAFIELDSEGPILHIKETSK